MALSCDEIEARVVSDRYRAKEAFAAYYKASRDRSEKCLGEIIEAICAKTDDTSKLRAVADALVRHYSEAPRSP